MHNRKCLLAFWPLIILFLLGSQINPCWGWGWKSAQTPDDVMNFLNSSAGYQMPVIAAKISASEIKGRTEFTVFYESGSQPTSTGGWGWKRSTTPDDMMNFLNGTGAYKYPVKKALLCAVAKPGYIDFIAFYQPGDASTPKAAWGWKRAPTLDDALDFLNGAKSYTTPVKDALIVTTGKDNQVEHYIFYQRGSRAQIRDQWQCEKYNQPDQVMTYLNSLGNYPRPVLDKEIITSVGTGLAQEYYVFRPQGMVIVTRPLFVNELAGYTQWKQSYGFEVSIVTAEWIQAHVSGADLRVKIRNAIRHYHRQANVNYALLIGDSVDEPSAPDATVYQEPPAPTLNEPWSLPAGYYRWEVWNNPQYASLYYADLNDKTFYPKDEFYWDGNYAINVGLMPVRTALELQRILTKTMAYQPGKQMTFTYSWDLYGADVEQQYNALQALASAAQVSTTKSVFDQTAAAPAIYQQLFERMGILYESGHGNVGIFKIGNLVVSKDDSVKFKQTNPLMITSSCSVQAYHLGECLDEAFLKGDKGPVVIHNGIPWGSKPQGAVWSNQEKGYWQDLLAGKSIGQAFYGHASGSWQNPLHLFGDPSLVVVEK
jgi:hypothetical protein